MRGIKIPPASRIPHQLTTTQLRCASRHMQQQCWLWGCDIRHGDGNLLIEYGFTRYRPKNPLDGSSLYVHATTTYTVMLWGFGMYVGDEEHGGVFIFRHVFDPIAVRHPNHSVCTPDAIIKTACPPTHIHHEYTVTALAWLVAYEAWVVERMGLDYRQQSIANWPKQTLQTQYQTFIDDWRHCAQAVRLPLTIYPVLSTT
jgi:hypothetical protein